MSGYLRNSTTSASSSLASSTPATSAKVTVGLLPVNSRARLLPNEIAWLLLPCACRIMKTKMPIKISVGKRKVSALNQPPHRLARLRLDRHVAVARISQADAVAVERFEERRTWWQTRFNVVLAGPLDILNSNGLVTFGLAKLLDFAGLDCGYDGVEIDILAVTIPVDERKPERNDCDDQDDIHEAAAQPFRIAHEAPPRRSSLPDCECREPGLQNDVSIAFRALLPLPERRSEWVNRRSHADNHALIAAGSSTAT